MKRDEPDNAVVSFDGGRGVDIWRGADGEWYAGERGEPFRNLTTSGKWEPVRQLKSGMPEHARHMQFVSVGVASLALLTYGYPDGTKPKPTRAPKGCPAVYGDEDVTLTGWIDWKGRRVDGQGRSSEHMEAFVEVVRTRSAWRNPADQAAQLDERWLPASDLLVDGQPLVGALLGSFAWVAV